MANLRLKVVRVSKDSTPRLPGLDAKEVWRAPQFDPKTGAFLLFEDVHVILNEQTGLVTVKRVDQRDGRLHTFIMAFSRAWFGVAYEPDELKAVDEEIAKMRAAREEADAARGAASTKAQKVA